MNALDINKAVINYIKYGEKMKNKIEKILFLVFSVIITRSNIVMASSYARF